ncbi:MAG: ParA family partition ATPase [Deltaproteobacteria bacterium]
MITAFLNQKGGVGKTTLSYSFATALVQAGHKVLLVDADPQHGAITWQEHRETDPLFPIVGLPTDKLHREMAAHTANYSHIVIDAPPQVSGIARSIILASDLILIPVQPSPHDIWSAADIVHLIDEASAFKENLKTAFVVNRKIANTALGRDVFTALENYPFPVLPTAICQRVAFAESAAIGASVLETEPNGSAAREILSLTREALEMMNHDEKNRSGKRHKKAR